MNDFILKSYVDKLSINHIKEYAKKNNIVLKNNEDEIIYDYIKKYYKEFLQGNDTLILNNLKKEISENTYNHIINLYKEYKRKLT